MKKDTFNIDHVNFKENKYPSTKPILKYNRSYTNTFTNKVIIQLIYLHNTASNSNMCDLQHSSVSHKFIKIKDLSKTRCKKNI